MKRASGVLFIVVLFVAFAAEARAQWQSGNLALKTNGNSFEPGDQLKLEAVALKEIAEPIFARVSYSFVELVKVKDEDGKEKVEHEERTRGRAPGPVIESFKQFQSIVLDDSLYFGEGSPVGRYTITVEVFNGYTRQRVATLRACVFYLPKGGRREAECSTYVRGLRRANSEQWLTFDGTFSDKSRYSATFFAGGRVVRFVEYGVTTAGAHELNISSEELLGTKGQTYDILVHDHENNYSSTVSRVTIPTAP